ncbi:MAG: putative Ig domain-containing protein, partial [Microcystaceae cyanobacterium]
MVPGEEGVILVNSAQTSTAVGDVNADGFDDILINQAQSYTNGNLGLGGNGSTSLTRAIPIQGLPNRQTLYQTGQAGDINGDGYDDFLMADQDYKLTYAVYGQDWEPQTATWNSNVTVQPMEGTNGNDVFQSNPSGNFLLSINGQNGDDYVNTQILPASQTQLFLFKGGQGDDKFGLPATDSSYITQIDGGSGYDTLFIQESAGSANSIDLTKLYQKISNIEEIDLGYENSVIFDSNSLLQILDSNKTLIINGANGAKSFAKPSDQNNSNWSQTGEDTYNGKIYQIYSYANTAVEVWVQKGGVTWSPSNQAPTDLALSASTVNENVPANTVIGALSTTDPDTGDNFTYSLAAGDGATDNSAFSIVGNQLQINNSPDFETQNNYSIRVKTADQGGLGFEKVLTITVNNVNETPIVANPIADQTAIPNQLFTFTVPINTFSDIDGDDLFYSTSLEDGTTPLPSWLSFDDQTLQFSGTPENGDVGSLNIGVFANDGFLTVADIFTLQISNVNDAPTDVALSATTVDENVPANTVIGTFSTTDPNTGDSFTYSLVAGDGATDNSAFSIVGNQLQINNSPDFETQNNYSIRVKT